MSNFQHWKKRKGKSIANGMLLGLIQLRTVMFLWQNSRADQERKDHVSRKAYGYRFRSISKDRRSDY